MKLKKALPLLTALTASVTSLPAASTWTGAVSNDYGTAGNWNPSGVPGVGTDVVIGSGSATVNGNWDRRGAGTTLIEGTGVVSFTAGQGRFLNTGLFTMTGGSVTQSGEYYIAGAGGLGQIVHSGGTYTATLRRGFQLSDNNITQSGTSYTLSGSAVLNVSSSTDSGVDEGLRGVWLGKGGEAGGTASAAIGTATGDLFSASGGTATFTKTGTSAANVRISRNSGLIVSGATVTFSGYDSFRVGHGASGGTNARVIVDSGSLSYLGGGTMFIGQEDAALLQISSGTVTLEGLLSLGATSLGTVVMNGGLLDAAGIVAPNGVFTFNGGEINLDGDQSSLLTQSWFQGVAGTTADYNGTMTRIYVVPEPGSAMLALGAAGLFFARRRRIC